MREFFDRLNMKIAEFMQGRYGMDALNKFIIAISFIFLIIGPFISPVDMIGWIFILLLIFRALSKNISQRQKENNKFLMLISKPKKFFTKKKLHWQNRKTTVYFRCSACKQELWVPKGKGKIRIICPKCKKEIFKTT